MDMTSLLCTLCNSVCIGHLDETLKIAEQSLGDLNTLKRIYGHSMTAFIKGKSDRTILLDAHIDEIGFIVTDVDDEGFVKVDCAGGFDIRTLPSHRVIIHGKEDINAVFTSIPPHLSEGDVQFDDIKKLSLDTGLGATAKEYIKTGDLVTYDRKACVLANDRVSGKSLDNRAGVAALLYLADMLKGECPPVNVCLLFSNQEELGCRGAKTASFEIDCDEAISIDVSFASFPGIAPDKCGTMGKGPMIGQSPILSRKVVSALISAAENGNIPYQLETMSGTTSTNADAISVSKTGVPTGLVSVPQRNMHTDAEVVSAEDVVNTAKLLYAYIMAGGATND